MLKAITGKPRAGKTASSVWQLIHILGSTRLPVVTNMDSLRLDPWIDGKGKPQIGLRAVLRKLYGSECDIDRRLLLLTEQSQVQEFFRYRPIVPEDPDLPRSVTVLECPNGKFSIGREPVIAAFIDEAHIPFPGQAITGGRDQAEMNALLLSYCSQAARTGDQVYVMSQVMTNVSKRIRDCCQDCTYVLNRKHRSLGFFRDRDTISFALYSTTPPKDGEEPLNTGNFKYPRSLVFASYDTSAGQGVAVGSRPADLNEKAAGLPLWTIPIGGLAILAGAYFLFGFLNEVMGAFSRKLFYGSPKSAQVQQTNSARSEIAVLNSGATLVDFANLSPKKDSAPVKQRADIEPEIVKLSPVTNSAPFPVIKSFGTVSSSGPNSSETLSVVTLESGLQIYGSRLRVTGEYVSLDDVKYRYAP